MDSHTFTTLKALVLEHGRAVAVVHAQIESVAFKETRDGKPFFEFALADCGAKLTLRVWSDSEFSKRLVRMSSRNVLILPA